MLEFSQIRDQYPKNLHALERSLMREYLQFKILQGIFDSRHASRLSFIGGTALRIIHGNNRFSEDIDLDNFGLSWDEFTTVIDETKAFLELDGYEVEVRKIEKGAYHCYIRFPDILFKNGISPIRDEKILIRIDSVAQGYGYKPELKILNKFDVFVQIRVTPLAVLLSQKIYAAINRARAKGRDFYDITFLLSQTKPDYKFLHEKLGIESPEDLRRTVLERIKNYDFDMLAKDVAPFLISKNEQKRITLFKDYWRQAILE